MSLILTFGLMFVVFYFLLIRPQQKRQKQRTNLLNSIKKGDKISTIGGMHGTIVELSDSTVVLRVNDTTTVTFDRSAISTVLNSAPAPVEAELEDKNEKLEPESTL